MINIHNGDVVATAAQRAAIPGEHFVFRETLATGPVAAGGNFLEQRARFLSESHGTDLLRVSNSLFEQEQALTAAGGHDEIVLWFEHDLFCLINLIHLLQRLPRKALSLIWSAQPLSTCDAAGLGTLFDSRAPVSNELIATASVAWNAYTSPDPLGLNALIESAHPEFPFLREGLTLHAARFPARTNGLGNVENRILTLIGSGYTEFLPLFDTFDEKAPRFGFGDAEVLRVLRQLAGRDNPLITLSEVEGHPPKAVFGLTPAGENILHDEGDDVILNEPDSWLGGAHLTKQQVWRWDEAKQKIV